MSKYDARNKCNTYTLLAFTSTGPHTSFLQTPTLTVQVPHTLFFVWRFLCTLPSLSFVGFDFWFCRFLLPSAAAASIPPTVSSLSLFESSLATSSIVSFDFTFLAFTLPRLFRTLCQHQENTTFSKKRRIWHVNIAKCNADKTEMFTTNNEHHLRQLCQVATNVSLPAVWCRPSTACVELSAGIRHVTGDVWPGVGGHCQAWSSTAAAAATVSYLHHQWLTSAAAVHQLTVTFTDKLSHNTDRVMTWLSCNVSVSINLVALCRAELVLAPSLCVDQLSLPSLQGR